jgi:SAM-dependent methyltransferase
MEPKDLFSGHAQVYAAFRPTYPDELYAFILSHLQNKKTAWDCATGNGQVAGHLAPHFEKVFATDISQQQLNEAKKVTNIFYSVSPAEKTDFTKNQFDLITVGQALHWFKIQEFYREVNRTLKPGGLLAIWGYALLNIEPEIDRLFVEFYSNTVGPYWDEARRLVENQYRDIPFPFELMQSPEFYIRVSWSLHHFAGYLTSWSATQKYIHAKGTNPVDALMPEIKKLWKEHEEKHVTFPVFLKLGRKI